MKSLLAVACLILTMTCVSIAMEQQSPRIIAELTEESAGRFHQADQEKSLSATDDGAVVRFIPLFHKPLDPEKQVLWYAHGLDRWFRIENVGENHTVTVETAMSLPEVQKIVPEPVAYSFLAPDDYIPATMWGLDKMDLPDAWDIQSGDSPVLVCTLDSGCDIFHEDLADNIWINLGEDLNGNGQWDESDENNVDDDQNGFVDDIIGWDFVSVRPQDLPDWLHPVPEEDLYPSDNRVYPDVYGHGTHIAGLVAGVTDNGIGIASPSWNVRHLPLRFMFAYEDDDGNFLSISMLADGASAIQYAADMGVRVLNMSWGDPTDFEPVQAAIDYARDLGVLMIAAAGNSDNTTRNYPAAYPSVISVAATDILDHRASFSSYGSWIDLCAPGMGILSTISDNVYHPGNYHLWDGTSMASGFVSGVAALIFSYNPDFTRYDVTRMLLESTVNIDELNPGYEFMLGYGRVDAFAAMQLAENDVPEMTNELPGSFIVHSLYPNPFNAVGKVTIELPFAARLRVSLFNIEGRLVKEMANRNFHSGVNTISLDASSYSSGVYFLRVDAPGGAHQQFKWVLLK